MTINIPVELIDQNAPSIVVPQNITVYLPDELPNTPTLWVGVEATSYEPELRRRCNIYREVELPTSAVAASFEMVNLKVKVKEVAANLLFANFNYRIKSNNT